MFFVAMEEEVQLNVNQIPSAVKATDHDNLKHKLLESIYSNDNVMYYWSLISEDAEEIDSIKVMKMISLLSQVLGWNYTSKHRRKAHKNHRL